MSSEPNVETTFRLIFVFKYLSDVTNLWDGETESHLEENGLISYKNRLSLELNVMLKKEQRHFFALMCIYLNFTVAPCINNIRHFIVQLMHTNYKILRLLK